MPTKLECALQRRARRATQRGTVIGSILPTQADETGALDPVRVRADFPALCERGVEPCPVYLDNAATTLRPRAVVDVIADAYAHEIGSVRRGGHGWARRATDAYERARARVGAFLGADAEDVVFVRGTTEALNLIAECWARPRLGPGDEILVSELEHHSNFLPWQRVASQTGAQLVIAPVRADGQFDLGRFEAHLGPRTALVACVHVSNVLGSVLPLREISRCVRSRAPRAAFVVDGAQAAAHTSIDVDWLDCDFYAFSGHKVYGPSGIGALFGRRQHWARMPPYQLGGGMVTSVGAHESRYLDAPHRFEAGTPNVAGALGLAAALDYFEALDPAALRRHEAGLIALAADSLRQVPGVQLVGCGEDGPLPGSLLSFSIAGVHPHDVGTVLDMHAVAVRAGHHCAQPLMRRLALPGTVRLSVAAYTTRDDVHALVEAVHRARELLA